MLATVSVYDAKTQFSQLINRVEAGEEIIISRNGKPVARLVALAAERPNRTPGLFAGQITMSPDFDEFSPSDDRDWYDE